MKAKKFMTVIIVSVVLLGFGLSGEVFAYRDKSDAVQKATDAYKSGSKKVRHAIKGFLGSSFEAECKKAMENLKKNPASLELQEGVLDVLILRIDKLSITLEEAKDANLSELRDNVVENFESISRLKKQEAQRYQDRANRTEGQWKVRYEQLSKACSNMSEAYTRRAETHKKLPIDKQLAEIGNSIHYLSCVKEVLQGVQKGITLIKADEETLKILYDTTAALDSIQNAVLEFSEVVLSGAIEASGELTTSNTVVDVDVDDIIRESRYGSAGDWERKR